GAVAAEGAVAASPELVAVALVPVARRAAAVGRLPRGRRLDPLRGDELLALPLAFLVQELAELRDVLRSNAQAVATGVDPLRALLPRRVLDSEGLEQPRLEVIQEPLPGDLLHDGRQHVRGRRVVEEVRPRLEGDWMGEERLRPGLILGPL